jgi:hypothetical protein
MSRPRFLIHNPMMTYVIYGILFILIGIIGYELFDAIKTVVIDYNGT